MQLKSIITTAWEKTDGFKATFWQAALYYILIALAAAIITAPISYAIGGSGASALAYMLFSTADVFVLWPIGTGILMLCLNRLRGRPVHKKQVFDFFKNPYYLKIVVTGMISILFMQLVSIAINKIILIANVEHGAMHILLNVIGHIALVLFTVFTVFAISFAKLLLVDKNMPAINALIKAYSKTLDHAVQILLIALLQLGLVAASVLTLLVGFIWTAPLIKLLVANLFEAIF